jgi:hypothetical protein
MNGSQKAFGIVEVLVAIGLVAIMAVGITSMLTGTMKSQKGIQAKDQQREVTAEVRTLLNDKTACLNSFGGQNPQTGFSILRIKDAANVARYTIGANDKTGMLTFKEFRVDNWLADAGYTTQGNSDLKIKLSKVGDTGTVKDISPDVITLKTKRNAAGNIIECFSIGTKTDGFWQISPSNPSDIFFSGGNVGIGTSTPGTGVGMSGGLTINSTSSTAITLEKNGVASFAINPSLIVPGDWVTFDKVGGIWNVSITSRAGNVGIGTTAPKAKLDVAGAVKVGYMAVCSPTNEGSQRYNSGLKNMEFCDGASWKAFGGGGGFVCVAWAQHHCGSGFAEGVRLIKSLTDISGQYPSGSYAGPPGWCKDIVSCVPL